MTGKPAARTGDMTKSGGPIVQGSAGVFIGAPTGVACSVCPGGRTSGSPVNPLTGAKVLPGETDIALPGPLPFVLTRAYSSYRTKTPAPAGLFGPGWKAPFDIHLQVRDTALILNDNGGRSIHFEPLLPGETAFSRSEAFWLARGGAKTLPESSVLHRLWQALPEDIRISPHLYLATNSPQGPWWILGWPVRVPGADEILPAPLPPYRVLTGLADNFGRTLSFHRAAEGEFTGHVTGVTDGAGRHFRLVLSRQAASPSEYGPDSGIRLQAVWLTRDPAYPDTLPAAPLVRYEYTPRGELAAVYDRGGVPVRRFEYDEQHPGRMVAHAYAGRPAVRYRYDAAGRVTAQDNPAGLSYRYDHATDRVVITDSLNRRTVLHTQGEDGLKRVVREVLADGSMMVREFDNAGRMVALTAPDGRRTQFRHSPASGSLTARETPDGRVTEFYYNRQQQLTDTVAPDGLTQTQAYDEYGRLTQVTSPRGDITRWFYDDPHSDLPSATEDGTGSRRTMTWSRHGQLLTVTDCSGYETRHEYDRFGQLTAVHREAGLSVRLTYDTRGRLLSRTDAIGRETRYEYNAAGDLTAVIQPDGSRHETEYDAAGHPVRITAGGLTRRLAYDPAGRMTQLTNENGSHSTFMYDALDRLTEETGFDGRTQRYRYDRGGRLVRSGEEGLVTLWHYDAADRLTHRTVNGEPAEEWQYDGRGWLTSVSHLSDGHRVAVHYGYDDKGRLIREQQTVQHPDTGALLWQHDTQHDYQGGLKKRTTPDRLPPVEWLTCGPGYPAGMKLGDTPLLDFTRDRLHRETQRRFGEYVLTTAYTPAGELHRQTLTDPALNREYGYDDAGQLTGIRGLHEQRNYQYDAAGRLTGVRDGEYTQSYFTDPAGNRTADRDICPALPVRWQDNRIMEDATYVYHYDVHGRLTEKDERRICPDGSLTHHYAYDSRHRLTRYRLMQRGDTLTESRYLYDPAGRRVGKRVWRSRTERESLTGKPCRWLNPEPEVTWYGWDGERLTTTQTDATRIQTLYLPGSFTPLIRTETATEAPAKPHHRSLAEKLQQEGGVTFPPELVKILDTLEAELRRGELSEASRAWLAQCGLTAERLKNQLEPVLTPALKIHLYHCDHRGLPLALINADGSIAWRAEYDEWGNLLHENNPHNLQQLIRLPGQQYDAETGLYYNRHRYYDPQQGRYITQDPIGLRGGWNLYEYPLNPLIYSDPLGLATIRCIKPLHSLGGTGEKSGPDIWGNPFYHQYLCVPDGKGDYICGGQDQRGEYKTDGLWGPGKASSDTKSEGGGCESVEKDNDCIEDCLKEKFKEPRPRYTVLPDSMFPIKMGLFKNCQDWADDTLETCRMKCSGNDFGRLIRFVLTGKI